MQHKQIERQNMLIANIYRHAGKTQNDPNKWIADIFLFNESDYLIIRRRMKWVSNEWEVDDAGIEQFADIAIDLMLPQGSFTNPQIQRTGTNSWSVSYSTTSDLISICHTTDTTT